MIAAAAVVRLATMEDAPEVARIHVESWRATYQGLMPEAVLSRLSIEQRTVQWRERLGRPTPEGGRVWLAEERGRARGFASSGPSRDGDAGDDVAELYAIYLDPRDLGRGYGRALFERCVAQAKDERRRALTLWVLAENARARRFYERAGMTLDGASKDEQVGGAPLAHVRYRCSW